LRFHHFLLFFLVLLDDEMGIPDNHFDGSPPASPSPLPLEGVEVITIEKESSQALQQPFQSSLMDLSPGLFPLFIIIMILAYNLVYRLLLKTKPSIRI
jgi:hypothetical protein